MRLRIVLALAASLAGCQATGQMGPQSTSHPVSIVQPTLTTQEAKCAEAANKAAKAQANAALLGGVLSMAGGLGGLAGNGGAIAGQAASVAGSMLQSQVKSEIASNCYDT